MSNQSISSYPISFLEATMYTEANQESKVVTTLVYGLSNTVYRAIVRFYDEDYDQIPSNGVYNTDYNVNFPLGNLGGFLAMVENKTVTFHFDHSNSHATFTVAP